MLTLSIVLYSQNSKGSCSDGTSDFLLVHMYSIVVEMKFCVYLQAAA
jgi:hypothetical protein